MNFEERFDLNKLLQFARNNQISIEINFWESSDELEVRTISAADTECFYMKRAPTVDYFIEQWGIHVKEGNEKYK